MSEQLMANETTPQQPPTDTPAHVQQNDQSIQEPPKKKKKTGNRYWLVKVPKWVAEEWFDPTKYGPQQRLADLYILPHENPDRREMKLELTPSLHSHSHSHNTTTSSSSLSSLSEFDDIAIPSKMKMDVRADRQRVNVKHGELTVLGKDRLLLFYDKPAFPVGSKVEALDTTNHSSSQYGSDAEPDNHNNNDDDEDEDDDIKMKSKPKHKHHKKSARGKKKNVFTAIKGYARGVIKGVNADRTYTVQFEHGNKMRYAVPERDIRFIDADEADKANKCKIQAVVHTEMDMVPQWTPQYKEYLKIRAMRKSMQKSIKLKEKIDVYSLTEAERKKHADEQIEVNRRERDALRSSKSSSQTGATANEGKPKRVKSVRRDDEVYQSLVFAAFDQQSVLSQKDIVQKCSGEKWNFLRPIVEKLCTAHKDKSGKNGNAKLWALKAEYRLSTDAHLESNNYDGDEAGE